MTLTVATFYKFVTIDDCDGLRTELCDVVKPRGILGTILIAPEGINGTVAGSAAAIDALLAHLHADARFADLEAKISNATEPPFRRLKIKIKPEIVTFGVAGVRPDVATGAEVAAKDWNALIARDDVIIVDTRNAYEVAIGTFPKAIDPGTENFQDFRQFVERDLATSKDKPVAMFCTGGIRCEKASSYLLSLGFREVYQLKGGILKYLEDVPAAESVWQGECFVFDGRIALEHGVREGHAARCTGCGQPFVPAGPAPENTRWARCSGCSPKPAAATA